MSSDLLNRRKLRTNQRVLTYSGPDLLPVPVPSLVDEPTARIHAFFRIIEGFFDWTMSVPHGLHINVPSIRGMHSLTFVRLHVDLPSGGLCSNGLARWSTGDPDGFNSAGRLVQVLSLEPADPSAPTPLSSVRRTSGNPE